ncbi:hypothetical protein BBK82_42705 [Lentzea guizhouensis]|uniref:Uncharacterized protein n=1 Tax=Lentzea guizhouensis TaxID=1586287 RepID=A0A1B2HV96_9PSEU|nr:hypothetical protein [Lentzea guizhouensis]ANZ41670.1 hypothetical protein BBK82_42705 [Lentzea guizhouensis]
MVDNVGIAVKAPVETLELDEWRRSALLRRPSKPVRAQTALTNALFAVMDHSDTLAAVARVPG